MTTPSHELVLRAADGDRTAWRDLVDRYGALVWAVARAHGLTRSEAGDAAQNAWCALARHLAVIRRPDRVAAWLATTTRRECLRVLASRTNEVPDEHADAVVPGPEPWALRSARDRALWAAFESLPVRCRRLLGLLAHAPELTYGQLGGALGMPVSSIGRTRARCLDVLRRRLTSMGEGPE